MADREGSVPGSSLVRFAVMAEVPAGGARPRYETLFRLAAGGMATVFVGTARGAMGFRQIVAIKKPHPHLLDATFRKAFVTEARLASLLHHANVVDVRDIEVDEDEVSLIMAYIEGASFGELLQIGSTGGPTITPAIAIRVVLDACAGLQAAHELADERGRPLHLVHRDVSPQNLLVGVDGVTRVADFGIAKFKGAGLAATSAGTLKGKVAYMAPEYLLGDAFDRRYDIFAMGVVLWEGITGRRLFRCDSEVDTIDRVMHYEAPSVASFVPELGTAFDAVINCALAKAPSDRFDTAAAFGAALEASARSSGILAGHREVADLVQSAVGPQLEERRGMIRDRLAHEPSVASVSFESERAKRDEDLAETRQVKPLPNSSLESAVPLVVRISSPAGEGAPQVQAPSTTLPDRAPRGLTPTDPPAPLPQVTQPLPPTPTPARREPLPPRKPPSTKTVQETLRSEAAANLISTEPRPPAPPGNRTGTATDPPKHAKKKKVRPWPYIVAILLGAIIGIGVAIGVGRSVASSATPRSGGSSTRPH
jgi:serine/threonine protein kinase